MSIKELAEEKNPYIELIKEQEDKKIKFIEEESRIIKKVQELEERLKYYEFWKVGYGKTGLPNILAESSLEEIEHKTNEILSGISDGMYIEIKGQKETSSGDVKEKILYEIHSKNSPVTNYKSYSGGERQRVQIADIFAFNKVAGKFNFVFLDEVLEMSLDTNGRSQVVDILREVSSDCGSLFVISHTDSIKDSFDNVISVQKVDGVSTI